MTQPRARIFLAVLGAAVLFAGGTFVLQHIVLYRSIYRTSGSIAPGTTPFLFANGIRFEIATTTAAKERGLSGRVNIPSNYGMLFVFKRDKRYDFWMKDMLTPIDIIWLSDNGTIIGIENSVSPASYPNVLYPSQPIKYVLEMRAGGAQSRGWKKGTVVVLPLPYGKNTSR